MIPTFISGFSLSVFAVRVLEPLAIRIGFVDSPGTRKWHDGEIPLVGGLAIYAALLALCLIFPFWRVAEGTWLIAIGFPLLLTGMADDKWQLSSTGRLLVEICCSVIAVVYCDIGLDDMGHLLPQVGGTLVLLMIPVSVLGMVGVINSFNMSDGVDGLAGGLATLTFGALAWLTFPVNAAVALQLICFVAVLLGFLVFNSRFFGRKHAYIFMGDGGSIFIGFALAWYLIRLSQEPGIVIRPVSALWLFAVPLLDTVTIMSRRILRGQSPFAADREHLHHILLRAGLSVNRAVLVILALHLVFILCGVASLYLKLPDWIGFVSFIGVFVLYYWGMNQAWKKINSTQGFTESRPGPSA